jgi:hypothetical protein
VLSDFFSWYTSSRQLVSSPRGDIKRSEGNVLALRLPKHGIADRKVENAPVFEAEEFRSRARLPLSEAITEQFNHVPVSPITFAVAFPQSEKQISPC